VCFIRCRGVQGPAPKERHHHQWYTLNSPSHENLLDCMGYPLIPSLPMFFSTLNPRQSRSSISRPRIN
jgi:hypothetical protein